MRNRFERWPRGKRARSLFADVLEDRRLLSGAAADTEVSASRAAPAVMQSWADASEAVPTSESSTAPSDAETAAPAQRSAASASPSTADDAAVTAADASTPSSVQTAAAPSEAGSTEDAGSPTPAQTAAPIVSSSGEENTATPPAPAPSGAAAIGSTSPLSNPPANADEADNPTSFADETDPAASPGAAQATPADVSALANLRVDATVDVAAHPVAAAAASPAVASLAMAKGMAAAVTAADTQTAVDVAGPGAATAPPGEGRPTYTQPSRAEREESAPLMIDRGEAPDRSEMQPLPARSADLLASFSPFDRATLERAIDQFLDRFGALETELSHWGTTERLAPYLMTSALVIGAAEVVRRRLQTDKDGNTAAADGDRSDSPFGLPGLPHALALEER